MSGVTETPDAESTCDGAPVDEQSVARNAPAAETGVAAVSTGEGPLHPATTRAIARMPGMTVARSTDRFIPAGYGTRVDMPYMLARSRSTRSSTLTNGSLHNTVRWA